VVKAVEAVRCRTRFLRFAQSTFPLVKRKFAVVFGMR
jgi:hypothetical protein